MREPPPKNPYFLGGDAPFLNAPIFGVKKRGPPREPLGPQVFPPKNPFFGGGGGFLGEGPFFLKCG